MPASSDDVRKEEENRQMMMSQLGRVLLSRSPVSPDEQEVRTDESGSYGGLMDAIDRAIEDVAEEPEPSA